MKISKEEWKVLYLCDDAMGLIWLIAAELNIREDRVVSIINKLLKEGLIETDTTTTFKDISPSDKRFFYTTPLGKEQL